LSETVFPPLNDRKVQRGLFIATAPPDAVIYFFPHPGNSAAMASQCQV